MWTLVCLIVAVILFILSAIPPVPYGGSLRGIGLAFFAGSFLAGRLP